LRRYPPAIQSVIDRINALPELSSASLATALHEPLGIDDVAPWIKFNVENYSRNLVARAERWELRLMCWRPGQSTSLHGHGPSACSFRILRGNAAETVLGQRDRMWAPGAVIEETLPLVHQVSNASHDALISLHAYGPALPIDSPSPRDGRNVVIVGGGFAGVATAIHLLRRASQDLRVTVVERGPWLGRGVAYGVDSPVFRLNVPASRMSVDPARPEDFVTWAAAERDPHAFLARTRYGAYVESRFAEAIRASRGKVRIIRGDVAEVKSGQVRLSDGRALKADAVVLATGIEPRVTPSSLESDPRIIDAWDEAALPTLPQAGRILVLGSGLSAIDVVTMLYERDFRGNVTILSRHGLLPRAHLPSFAAAPPIAQDLVGKAPGALRPLMRWVRETVDEMTRHGHTWQQGVDALRPHLSALWQALPTDDRARFVKRVRPFWETLRHRAPHDALNLIDDWRRHGTLEVVAGRVLACNASADGLDVEIRGRGGSVRHERYDALVRCIGPALEQSELTRPLVSSLLEGGLAARDAAGLGIVTDPRGAVVDAKSQPSSWLFALGALRRASAWETTAVPEIVKHAAEIARLVDEAI
jgi:uncharacterized NAD(P)/FAD-binding protein YdhS